MQGNPQIPPQQVPNLAIRPHRNFGKKNQVNDHPTLRQHPGLQAKGERTPQKHRKTYWDQGVYELNPDWAWKGAAGHWEIDEQLRNYGAVQLQVQSWRTAQEVVGVCRPEGGDGLNRVKEDDFRQRQGEFPRTNEGCLRGLQRASRVDGEDHLELLPIPKHQPAWRSS